jgi:prepilin-type N-terminal cleavage/methylation domain-containing protein
MIIKAGVSQRQRTQGFTLIEAMLAVTVLAFAAAGVLLPFVSGAAVRAEGIHRALGAGLARDLTEQILRLPFHDPDGANYSPGPELGETGLANFDNIDDFHGYIEAQGQVKDATGAVFIDPKYANFSRTVTCVYVTVPPQAAQADPSKCNFVLVTVQVDYSGKGVATLSRLVSE